MLLNNLKTWLIDLRDKIERARRNKKTNFRFKGGEWET